MANEHIEEIAHEMIPSTAQASANAITVEILSPDQIVKNEIARFDVALAAIEEYKTKYSGLKIADMQDKEGYKNVYAAWQFIRGKRLAVEKMHKVIKSDYLTISRGIDQHKNKLVSLLEPLENELGDELERIDKLIEDEKNREEMERQKRLQGRVAELLGQGMQFNGMYYCIGETISMDVVALKNFSDHEYSVFLQRVQNENKKQTEAKAEAERLELERIAQIENQKREQEAERLRLQRQAEEMEQQRAQMRKERTDLRGQILKNAGFQQAGVSFVYKTQFADVQPVVVTIGDFQDLTGDDWDKKFFDLKAETTEIRKLSEEREQAETEKRAAAEKERLERVARMAAREKDLFALGMLRGDGSFFIRTETYGDTNFFTFENISEVQDWPEFLEETKQALLKTRAQDVENKATRQREAEEQKEAAERDRIAAMSDIEKVKEFVFKLEQLARMKPELKNKKIAAAWDLFGGAIDNAKEMLLKTIELI